MNNMEILNKFSIFAYSEDNKILFPKRKFLRAINYKDIDWGGELLTLKQFLKILSNFGETHNAEEKSFVFYCDYTKKKKVQLRVNCISDDGKLEQAYIKKNKG